MKHTSVRLSEEHAAKIASTGKSPTVIIKKALDLYFGMPADDMEPVRRLIEEHVKTCHVDKHIVSTAKTASESIPHDVPQDVLRDVPIVTHKMSTQAQGEHMISTEARAALTLILDEIRAGREPTVNMVAGKIGLTTTGLGMILSKCGIKSKNTHNDMQTVRIYTKTLKAKIEEILLQLEK